MVNRSTAAIRDDLDGLSEGFGVEGQEYNLSQFQSTDMFEGFLGTSQREKVLLGETAIKDKEVTVFFTKDVILLDQYYELREKLFREVDYRYRRKHPEDCEEWEECDGSENIDDRHGEILVAVDNSGRVVGGMRCLISNWSENTLNEEPENGFTIRSFLKKAGFNYRARFSEVDDVVVDKGYRDRFLLRAMFSILVNRSINCGCEYIIGLAILSASRNHKIALASLGYQMDIIKDEWIKQKNHGYENRYPLIVYLK